MDDIEGLELPPAEYGIPWTFVSWYWYVGKRVATVILCIGLVGNVLSLLAFIKQLKLNHAYYHQISIIGTDLAILVLGSFGALGDWYFRVWDNLAPQFIQKSKILLNFLYLCYPLTSMCSTAALILLVGVSIDRLYALKWPTKYNNVKKKALWALGLAGFSHAIGIGTGVHQCFQMKTEYNDTAGTYLLIYDAEFNAGYYPVLMEFARILIRLLCMVCIFVLAIWVSKVYTKRMKEHRQLVKQGVTRNTVESVNETALTRLLLSQAVLVLLGMTPVCALYAEISLFQVDLWSTLGQILDMTSAISLTVMSSLNFLVYLCMSKQFRKALVSVLKRKDLTTTVTPAGKN